uniref:RRM domain-containing protein n=1 Tax=Aegilops tauschii subsp. strangulata TaxID=200361 RepID=A0A453KRE3_AEGTS
AFGFCEFESAESSLRARRLLNKLSVDGQELVLNVNQSTRDYLQRHGDRTIEEKASEADKDAIQKIRSMIIERLKSKLPGSPIPPVQVSASASIVDEKEDGDTRSSALEEREITRQCEKEKHLGKSKAVGLLGWKEREVTAARKSSLQIDAVQCLLK